MPEHMQGKAVLDGTSHILGLIYASRTTYVTFLGQFLAPSCSIRSRFTISSACANNANPVRVLTTVNYYFGKYKQRDYFSWVQHPAAQENMQSTWSIWGTVFHYKIEKKHVPLSKLLNLVVYLIRKTHKMTNKKRVQHQKQPILNLYVIFNWKYAFSYIHTCPINQRVNHFTAFDRRLKWFTAIKRANTQHLGLNG